MSFYSKYFDSLGCLLDSIDETALTRFELLLKGYVGDKSRKVVIFGNGGSASIAGHVAVDYTKVCGIQCLTFVDPALLTCFANDYGYENSISACIRNYCCENDLAIFVSSSGSSLNMLNGIAEAKRFGMTTVTFSGFDPDNPLRKTGDCNFYVSSNCYNLVESVHQIWLLAVCDSLAGVDV